MLDGTSFTDGGQQFAPKAPPLKSARDCYALEIANSSCLPIDVDFSGDYRAMGHNLTVVGPDESNTSIGVKPVLFGEVVFVGFIHQVSERRVVLRDKFLINLEDC